MIPLLMAALVVRECARCHPAEAKPHPATSMARAMQHPSDSAILNEHSVLTAQMGKYSYRIEKNLYTVSNGSASLTFPISWSFGLGDAGQTYVFEKDGVPYESRVSFFRAIDGLDWTLGASNSPPSNLLEAAGRQMGKQDAAECLHCHSTGAVASLVPGVQCERCHGSTDEHLTTLKPMKKLHGADAEEISNFCGQCHRTWADVAGKGILGVNNVRFQPYRLTNSKCFDVDDRRISCLGCHNPHQELDRNDAHYDAKCQACHAGGKPAAKVCKVSKSNCVSCHMPKIEIPGSHYRFTDHQIRIARANAPYPN
jgi:hypothetical protein